MVCVRRVVPLLLLAFVACGVELGEPAGGPDEGGKEDGTGSGSNPQPMPTAMTATVFLGKIGNQYCDESFRCKNTFPLGATGFANEFGTTVQECYAGASAFYMPQAVEQSITAGRILYSAAAASLCVAGVKYPADCNVFWQQDPVFPTVCGAVLVGTVADGGTCGSNFDCAGATSTCNQTTKRCAIEQ